MTEARLVTVDGLTTALIAVGDKYRDGDISHAAEAQAIFAALPAAAPAEGLDPERMEAALMGVWLRMQRGDMSAGGPNGLDMRHLWAAAVIEHLAALARHESEGVPPLLSCGTCTDLRYPHAECLEHGA